MTAVLSKKNQRELEQIIYTYEFPISLAVLTHITRHRMHSLMVPDFAPLNNLENYNKQQFDRFARVFGEDEFYSKDNIIYNNDSYTVDKTAIYLPKRRILNQKNN